MIKRVRWAGHVACMEKLEIFTKFYVQNPQEISHTEEVDIVKE